MDWVKSHFIDSLGSLEDIRQCKQMAGRKQTFRYVNDTDRVNGINQVWDLSFPINFPGVHIRVRVFFMQFLLTQSGPGHKFRAGW